MIQHVISAYATTPDMFGRGEGNKARRDIRRIYLDVAHAVRRGGAGGFDPLANMLAHTRNTIADALERL